MEQLDSRELLHHTGGCRRLVRGSIRPGVVYHGRSVAAEASNSAPKKMSSRPLTSRSFTSAGSWLNIRCQNLALSCGGRNRGGEGDTPGRGASETTRRSSRSG